MDQGLRGPQNKFVSQSIVEISKLPPISKIVKMLTHMIKRLVTVFEYSVGIVHCSII
jgi:hypothetical protein